MPATAQSYAILDIDCIGFDRATPIFVAAKHNSIEALKLLIKLHGSTSLCNSNGESPLHIASRSGHVDACKVCICSSVFLCKNKLIKIYIWCTI